MATVNVRRRDARTRVAVPSTWEQHVDLRAYAPRERHWTTKEIFDRSMALVLLMLTSPFLLLLGALVRITSPGPAIYSQIRIGRHGKLFPLYKFRSMYQNCEQKTGPVWASRRDRRVTPLGRVLRFTHCDELPQLFNVLRGEMSLVGPRPERPEITAKLRREFPVDYYKRLLVKPGVTGLAQVRRHADCDIADVRRKLRYDLLYVQNESVWLDVVLIFATLLMISRVVDHRTRARRSQAAAPAAQAESVGAEHSSELAQ